MNKEILDFTKNMENYKKLCVFAHYNFSSSFEPDDSLKWYEENQTFLNKTNLPNIAERIENEDFMFAAIFEAGLSIEQKIDKVMKVNMIIKNFKNGFVDENNYSQSFLDIIDSLQEADSPKVKINIFFDEVMRDNEIKDLTVQLDKVLDDDITIDFFDLKRFEINLKLKDELETNNEAEVKDFDFTFQNKNKWEDKESNIISYDSLEEEGIVLSIEAYSLAMAYEKFKNRLFDFNVRYSVNNGKINSHVDKSIKETIQKQKDKFWIFNNGITIVAKDFSKPDFYENKIHLKEFSIVNGAQTVTNLYNFWRSDKDKSSLKDVFILAKIIKPKDAKAISLNNVIETITKAANNQKPIKARDFKSNSPEMKDLKEFLKNRGVILNIKRGDGDFKDKEDKAELIKNKKFTKEEIINISNEELGQQAMALLIGKPWKALQNKTKIFEDEKIYNEIFKNNNLKEYDFYSIVKFWIDAKRKLNYCFTSYINLGLYKEKMASNNIANLFRSTINWVITALWMVAANNDNIQSLLESGDFKEAIYRNTEVKNINYDLNVDAKEFDEYLTYFLQDSLDGLSDAFNVAADEVKDSQTKKSTMISNSAFSFRETYFNKFLNKIFATHNKFEVTEKAKKLNKLFKLKD